MADHSTINQRSAGIIVFREDLFGSREYLLLDYGRDTVTVLDVNVEELTFDNFIFP